VTGPVALPSGQVAWIVVEPSNDRRSFTDWREGRCPHLLCSEGDAGVQYPVHHACQSKAHVDCLAHFGPDRCQACHLLLLALQAALAAHDSTSADVAPVAGVSSSLAAGGAVRRAALSLHGYAGCVHLRPEGPIMKEVLAFIDKQSSRDETHPAWVDRTLSTRCFHETHAEPCSNAFYLRHHAFLFAPLLMLTARSIEPLAMHEVSCVADVRSRCLGCALDKEHLDWVVARVGRYARDSKLHDDDVTIRHVLPERLARYASDVAPLLAALPPSFSASLAGLLGISTVSHAGGPLVMPSDAAPPLSEWAAAWKDVPLPASPMLITPIPGDARGMGLLPQPGPAMEP
jgi:hypothetical protein